MILVTIGRRKVDGHVQINVAAASDVLQEVHHWFQLELAHGDLCAVRGEELFTLQLIDRCLVLAQQLVVTVSHGHEEVEAELLIIITIAE